MTSTSQALFAGLSLAAVTVAVACAAQKGATQKQLADAKASAPKGAELYQEACAECHGPVGEGGPGVPSIMGGHALPVKVREKVRQEATDTDPVARQRAADRAGVGPRELRMRFNTAADIHKYMLQEHPQVPVPLDDEQLYQILTFVLDAHGVQVPEGGITAENAASVENEKL